MQKLTGFPRPFLVIFKILYYTFIFFMILPHSFNHTYFTYLYLLFFFDSPLSVVTIHNKYETQTNR